MTATDAPALPAPTVTYEVIVTRRRIVTAQEDSDGGGPSLALLRTVTEAADRYRMTGTVDVTMRPSVAGDTYRAVLTEIESTEVPVDGLSDVAHFGVVGRDARLVVGRWDRDGDIPVQIQSDGDGTDAPVYLSRAEVFRLRDHLDALLAL